MGYTQITSLHKQWWIKGRAILPPSLTPQRTQKSVVWKQIKPTIKSFCTLQRSPYHIVVKDTLTTTSPQIRPLWLVLFKVMG